MITDKEAELRDKLSERMGRISLFTITHVGHLMGKKANRELVRSGFRLQLEQLPILFVIYFSGDSLLSQQEIANLLHKDKSGIQRSVRTLERDGYLRIVADEVDRRKNLIRLTPAGQLVVEKVIETIEQIDQQVTNQLPADELSSFLSTLHKITSLLDK
ncbi:MarR family winged helix-turn-helix transcriptional regulator [Spirosoma oryzicola]|uniref:MarR family winged helix-turn-helix transcriptional regulator n=1 Tax=Spirosoma oryzicola TaxID=2898794 RepID=UPI001E4F1E80|nr:MarR family transcriptional regulator [Spirosoma oryzicola]UHG92012.1 MarR family transcriptional regulator [Spirosoma oryzicola]